MPRFFSWFLIIGFVGSAIFGFLLLPVSRQSESRAIEISSGMGMREIAGQLEDFDIIRSDKAFFIYSIFSGSAHALKPGYYRLNSASSTPAIIQLLSEGPKREIKITFPEGATLWDIDWLLNQAGVLPSGALINFPITSVALSYPFLRDAQSMEGFLFPDTYKFFLNSSTAAVVNKFLEAFEEKAWPLLAETDFKNKLVIASLIEKEVPVFRDRLLVSGILQKRLRAGMPLQVDATVTYAKCFGSFVTCEMPAVAKEDLKFQSRYNTYLYKGLPPGPISNPGVMAIQAALNPVSSRYWFYLSDPETKQTIFSETLDEHNDNRVIYLGS